MMGLGLAPPPLWPWTPSQDFDTLVASGAQRPWPPPGCACPSAFLPWLTPALSFLSAGFFLLGGLCVVWGGASYAVGLASLRGPMQLSLGGAAAGVGAVLAASLLWACAVGLYMGQLELDVELVPDDDGAATTEGPDEAGRPPPE